MLSRVGFGSSSHYHQLAANSYKNGVHRRNSGMCCPHVTEQRCAPIAQPESSDFESSRASYPPSQSMPPNQMTQQRQQSAYAGSKVEQKNGISRQNGARGLYLTI